MLFQKGQTILFYGDSITKRSVMQESPNPAHRYALDYSGSYVDILMKRLLVHYPDYELRMYNHGVGGDTAFGLLKRYQEDVSPIQPDWMVLMIGHNDIKFYDGEKFEKLMRALLTQCREDSIQVIQLSTVPHSVDQERTKKVDELDTIIKKLSDEFGTYFIDVKTYFKAILEYNKTAVNPIHLYTEGTHLSELGNIYIADELFSLITEESEKR